MEMKELGSETTWEPLPEKDAVKADMLCRVERADQELQMGLEWDDPGLKSGAVEDLREVLEDIRHNLTINFTGKDEMVKQAERDLNAFANHMDGLKAANEFKGFHEQVMAILDRW